MSIPNRVRAKQACAKKRRTPIAFYHASLIKRRATKSEMEERAAFLINSAHQHRPVSVRGLYYQAEVAGIPGIDKEENSYVKVQHQVLMLRRRAGRMPFIALHR